MVTDIFIEITVELIRSLLVEGVVERAQKLRLRPRLRGIRDVRRHVHFVTRKRLLNRLSTELGL